MRLIEEIIKSHHPRKHVRSFSYAFSGLIHIFIYEANFRVHIFATIVTLVLAYLLNFNAYEWMILILTIGFVLVLEMLNTLIEELIDHLVKEHHEGAKIIKDIGAALVLTASIISLVVGLILFLPKILYLFSI